MGSTLKVRLLLCATILFAMPTHAGDLEKCSKPSAQRLWKTLVTPYEKPECSDFWIRVFQSIQSGKGEIHELDVNATVSQYGALDEILEDGNGVYRKKKLNKHKTESSIEIMASLRVPYWFSDDLASISPDWVFGNAIQSIVDEQLDRRLEAYEQFANDERKRKLTTREKWVISRGSRELVQERVTSLLRRSLVQTVLMTPPLSSADKIFLTSPAEPAALPNLELLKIFLAATNWKDQKQIERDRILFEQRKYPTARQFLWDELHTNALNSFEQSRARSLNSAHTMRLLFHPEVLDPIKLWNVILPSVAEIDSRLKVSPAAPEFWKLYRNPFTKHFRDLMDHDYSMHDRINPSIGETITMGLTAWGFKGFQFLPLLGKVLMGGSIGALSIIDLLDYSGHLHVQPNGINEMTEEALQVSVLPGGKIDTSRLVDIRRVMKSNDSGHEKVTAHILLPVEVLK
jgi:hypothetical protein